MRRIFILMCGVVMISSGVFADDTTETCADGAGTVVIGAVTGHKYCRSNNKMNWWNAYAWCDAQSGRRLFSMNDCNHSGTSSACSDLKGTGDVCVWTSTPWSQNDQYSYYVCLFSGVSSGSTPTRSLANNYALCY